MRRRGLLAGGLATVLLLVGCGSAGTAGQSSAGPGAAVSGTGMAASAPSPGSAVSSTVPAQGASTTSAPPSGAPGIVVPQPSTALADGLRVAASVAGGPRVDMLVDTGSNGVVVARKYVGSAATPMVPAQPFTGFTYSSSGNSYDGEWMTVTVQLGVSGASDFVAQTTSIPVRVVERSCAGDRTSCTTDPAGIDVAMMGVGFDRGADNPDSAFSGPALNPFLQLTSMDSGTLPRAYLISLGQIVLGPTESERSGFQTVQLSATPATATSAPDWAAAPSCVAVPNAGIGPQCGTLLLDTGLGYAIIQAPDGVQPPVAAPTSGATRPTVQAGQQVSVSVTGIADPVYAFTVGGQDAPSSVQWGHDLHDGQPFMNISRYALTQVDYLFDAAQGQLGFRPVAG